MTVYLKLNVFQKQGSPCKDCTDRCVNCHTNCEKYVSWRAECDIERSKYIKSLQKEHNFKDYYMRKKRYRRKRVRNDGKEKP